MEIFLFLLAPFVASLILTGIHAYLGVHVVERGVVFVDLALAQIAALGSTVAVLYGFDPHGRGSYWTSLAFKFLGALVFSTVRAKSVRIPKGSVLGMRIVFAALLGFSFFSILRICRDLICGDRRRAAGVLLSDRAVRGRYALRRADRA